MRGAKWFASFKSIETPQSPRRRSIIGGTHKSHLFLSAIANFRLGKFLFKIAKFPKNYKR